MIELWVINDLGDWAMDSIYKITKLTHDASDDTVLIDFIYPDGTKDFVWFPGEERTSYIVYKGEKLTGDDVRDNYRAFKKRLLTFSHNSEIEDAVEKL